MRRVLVASLLLAAMVPTRAVAAPDPLIAGLLSAGSTVLPITIAGGLLATGRGAEEGIRFDISLIAIATGSIVGPSVGQIYGRGGVDAVVTFLIRAITGSVMTVGTGYMLRSDDPDNKRLGNALFFLGGVPTGILAVWDWFGAASAARQARYQEGHGPGASIHLELDRELLSLINCPRAIPCGI